MCTAPNTLADGTQTACHECWQCRQRKIDDWVGRNIAESITAKASYAITLTYGRDGENSEDHIRAAVLTYSDVQKFLKLLRRHGYDVRYFVTGEFGSKKGRAHWHIMLYFYGAKPAVVLDKNWMWEAVDANGKRILNKGKQSYFWPHGYVYITKPTHKTVRYNCKYILKDMGDMEQQGHLAMSKKPPLGTAYFQMLAERWVEHGHSPQHLHYTFGDVTRTMSHGGVERVKFMLKDRPAELYVQHFIERWVAVHGHNRWPNSDLVDLYWEYGQIVLDENRLMAVRNPKLAPYVSVEEKEEKERQQARPKQPWKRMYSDEIQSEIYNEVMKNGTEKQREFEQWKHAIEEQQHRYRALGKPDYVIRHEQRRAQRRAHFDTECA